MKANLNVRESARKAKIRHWQIAMHMGVSEQTFMRWLRTPLSEEKEKVILSAIEYLAKEVR